MFSLIITVIAIVLTGLLAVGTIYYLSGDSVTNKRAQAIASQFLNETEQVFGALTVYRSDFGGYPEDDPSTVATPKSGIQKLLDSGHLSSLPSSAEEFPWTIADGRIRAMPENASEASCLRLNEISGVLNAEGEVYIPSCSSPIANLGKAVCCNPD